MFKEFRISVISIQSKDIEAWDTQGKHLGETQTEVELGNSQTYLFMFLFLKFKFYLHKISQLGLQN